MESSATKRFLSDPANTILLSLAVATLVIHLLATALCAYGYFRDELYYIACTNHLDIGYVDQPPFSIYMLAVNRLLLGDSLIALRFLPAVASAVTVLLTGLMAREMGGGRFAQALAAVASIVSPIYLGMDGVFTMNCFDILVWTAAAYVLCRAILQNRSFDPASDTRAPLHSPSAGQHNHDVRHPERPTTASPLGWRESKDERPTTASPLGWRESKDERPTTALPLGGGSRRMRQEQYWLLLGLILGIGLLNKISILWLGAGIAIGLLLTPHRRWFRTPWPWVAGGIAFLVFLPYIIWNLQHDFAHLEFIRNASGGKYASLNPLSFIIGQVLLQNPVSLPIWLAGLWFFLFHKDGRAFRPLGIIYIVSFLILIFNGHSKSEYLSPSYGMLFAGGGVMVQRFITSRGWGWLRPAYVAVLVVAGCAFAPLVLPLMPVETFIRYQNALGVAPSTAEAKQLDKLPQFYADMFGWEEKAAAVARVFNTLTPEEKAKCAIFADNYGRCAAIDFFGPKYGLPKSIGNHNSYWIWGHRQYTGEIMIVLGGNPKNHKYYFEEVTVPDTASCMYCMPYENHLTISLCRRLKIPVEQVCAEGKHYE